jgi:tight adherence protein B
MILATIILVFLAIFCLAFGAYTLSEAVKQQALRRRLHMGSADIADVLDPAILRLERIGSGLHQLGLAHRIDRLLVQAGLIMTVAKFLAISVGVGLGAGFVVYLVIRHLLFAAFAAACVGVIPLLVVLYKKAQRVKAFDEQFPDALDLMVNALRAGFALGGAIQMVAEESPDPVGTEFRILFEEQKLGLDIKNAMVNLAERMDSTDVGFFATAVIVQRDTGGNLAEVLEKIAYVIRDRFRILGEVRTFTAQGRLSGFILGVLPIIMAIILTFLSPGYIQILLNDHFGKMLLVVAGVLQVLGFFAIRKIVSIKV